MIRHTLDKYRTTVAMTASAQLHDKPIGQLATFALRLMRVVLLLSLWRTLFADGQAVAGMTLDAVLTYTLISEVFSAQMSARTGLGDTLWQGIIANRLARPIGIHGQFLAEMVGGWVPQLCLTSLPMLLLAPWLGVSAGPASFAAGAWFVVSLTLAVAVGAALEILFLGLVAWFDQDVYAMQQIQRAVSVLASGAVVPLALMPWGIGDVLGWLPFAALASAPLRIYTGTGEPAALIGLQAAWAAVLWPLAQASWRANRERLAAHGG